MFVKWTRPPMAFRKVDTFAHLLSQTAPKSAPVAPSYPPCTFGDLDHFFFWKLHIWIIFFYKLVDQYGALDLHCVLLLLSIASFFLMTNWWITCLHGWSGKSWFMLLGSGGGGVWGR